METFCFVLLLFIYLKREGVGVEEGRGRRRENHKQAACPSQSLAQGSISQS